jgi:hypothetical protein
MVRGSQNPAGNNCAQSAQSIQLFPEMFPAMHPAVNDPNTTPVDDQPSQIVDFQKKMPFAGRQQTALEVCMVELGGFEPPSASLLRTVLHV